MALVVPLGFSAAGGEPAETKKDLPFEGLRAWPAIDITRWPGYDEITPIKARQEKDAANSMPLSEEQLAGRRSAAERLWTTGKARAQQAVNAVRPDLTALLDDIAIDATHLPHELTATHGTIEQPPRVLLCFAVDMDQVRLTQLYVYTVAVGDEPALDKPEAWQDYAETTIEKIFSYRPVEVSANPVVRAGDRSVFVDWRPMWRGVELPSSYWTQFGTMRHAENWVQSWTAPSSPQDLDEIRKKLDELAVNVSANQAAMIAVRNFHVFKPGVNIEELRVWAEMELHSGDYETPSTMSVIHADAQALERYKARGPIAPIWKVRVAPNASAPAILIWIDAVDGSVVQTVEEASVEKL